MPAEGATITVIVLVYNQMQFVDECLDSVVASDYSDIELVIVDDASRDASVAAVEAWIERRGTRSRVTFLRHPVNLGICASLNDAIAAGSGRYFAIVAADDRLLPGGLTARVAYLAAHPKKLAVFGNCRVIDVEGRVTHAGFYPDLVKAPLAQLEPLGLVPWALVFQMWFPGPGFLCRREAYETLGTYDTSLYFEDADFYLRLGATNRIGYLASLVADYRRHGAGTSVSQLQRISEGIEATTTKLAPSYRGVLRLQLSLKRVFATNARRPRTISRRARSAVIRAIAALARAVYRVVCAWAVIRSGRRGPQSSA